MSPQMLRLAATAASAGLYAVSFPPLELAPAAWLALAPLFGVFANGRPARAAGFGWLWGVLVCLATGWPLAGMLARNLDVDPWLGWFGLSAAAALLFAPPIATFGAWIAWITRRASVGPFTVAAGWVGCEWLRHATALGIPWAFSGYSQVPFGLVAQLADLGGPFAIAMLLAAVNATLAGAAVPELRGAKPWRQRAAVAALVVASLGYGAWRWATPFAEGEPIAVALVQGGATGSPRPDAGAARAQFERHAALTESLASPPPDLIFWPEFAVGVVPTRISPERARLAGLVRNTGADLVVGGPWDEIRGDRPTYWNAVFLIGNRRRARYEKEKPLWLAEREVFGLRDRLRLTPYSPGEHVEPLPAGPARLGIALCSEAMDPWLVRARVDAGAEVLVVPANDSWFESESSRREQLAIASLRAIENRRFVVRPTTTGYSAVIDPHGRIVQRSLLDRPDVLRADVVGLTWSTPWRRLGDLPLWGALAWVAFVSLGAIGQEAKPSRAGPQGAGTTR